MSDVFLEITDRAFGSRRPTTGELVFQPNSYRTASMGGPVEMSVTAYGRREALFDLIELLRCPIRMYDSYAQDLFWGFINEVQVRSDSLEVSVSLDNMANKVAIEYTSMVPGEVVVGEQVVSDWAQDGISIATYGTKELIASLPDVTTSVANAKRTLLLAEKKYPVATWYMSGERGSLSATLLCKGWWNTLGWRYYQNNSGYEAYTVSGEGVQPLGNTSATAYAAQSFQLGVAVGWYADHILVKVRKEEVPTDNIRVGLHVNSGSAPGAEQAYGTIPAAGVPTDYNWVDVELNTRVWLNTATTYWVVLSRSGALDATNYYFIDVNEELGYTRGVLRVGNGSTWDPRSPDADMDFQVQGVIETSTQLQTIASSVGQFITAIKLEIASGIYSCPYRPGTSTGLDDALELLRCGTTNGRRMLAEVTPSRVLRIFEEPAMPSAVSLLLTTDGRVRDRTGTTWPLFWSPVGKWVAMNDIIPATLDTSRIANPYMLFVDEYSYSFQDKVGTIYPRGKPSPWDVGVIATEDQS